MPVQVSSRRSTRTVRQNISTSAAIGCNKLANVEPVRPPHTLHSKRVGDCYFPSII